MGKPLKVRRIKGAVLPVDTGSLPRIHRNLIERPGDREVVGETVQWLPGRNTLVDAIDEALKEDDASGVRKTTSRPRGNA